MNHPSVSLTNLRRLYGDREALRGVTLDVEAGSIFGLLGPNGSGKTTLFRILATLLTPTDGTALIGGFDVVRERAAVRRKIGVVFQQPSLDHKLTVRENLMHQGHLYGLRGPALRERGDRLLARFGVADRARDRVETLSGGLMRRIELAKGLLHRPEVLILDEPSTGLDPGARRSSQPRLRTVSVAPPRSWMGLSKSNARTGLASLPNWPPRFRGNSTVCRSASRRSRTFSCD